MFTKLTDLSYKRTALQALGFYIAFFVLGVILGGVIGGLSGALLSNVNGYQNPLEAGLRGGMLVAVVYPVAMAFLVLRAKKMMNNFLYILLALLCGVLGLFGGALLGLIPVAFLTTK